MTKRPCPSITRTTSEYLLTPPIVPKTIPPHLFLLSDSNFHKNLSLTLGLNLLENHGITFSSKPFDLKGYVLRSGDVLQYARGITTIRIAKIPSRESHPNLKCEARSDGTDNYLITNVVDLGPELSLSDVKTFEILKNLGVDLHLDSSYPLKTAICQGNLELSKYLISDGKETNLISHDTLEIAVSWGHEEIIDYLLKESLYTIDSICEAFTIAKSKGFHLIADILQKKIMENDMIPSDFFSFLRELEITSLGPDSDSDSGTDMSSYEDRDTLSDHSFDNSSFVECN